MPDPSTCTYFQDLYQRPPDDATADEKAVIDAANGRREKVYRAIRYILINDFGVTSDVPEQPKDFPGNLTATQQAQFAAIFGIMAADNYTSPSLGRDKPTSDDTVIPANPPVFTDTVIVARRFAYAVVSAMQEYTAQARLFNTVFTFLVNEGTPQGS
jgi:hypothetical protein